MYPAPAVGTRPRVSGFANTSLALGIAGLFFWPCTFGVLSIVAVIFGHLALAEIKRTGLGGRTQALVGLFTGYGFLGVLLLGLIGMALSQP